MTDDVYDVLQEDEWIEVEKVPTTVEARIADEVEEIETREGTIVAKPGDVVIRGIAGEVYPCDPDIFSSTYRIPDTENE